LKEGSIEIMVRSHRILFPVSFSNYPFAVSPTVGELIDRPNVEVILLHVIDAGSSRASKFAHRIEMLDALTRRHFSHCTVRRRLDNGSPADRILDCIRENEIEMVVMPARDSDGFGKGPLGQVATRILREACCPVWLEWRNGGQQSVAPAAAARICCAIDGTRSAEQILRHAVMVANNLGGQLTIISPLQPSPNTPSALFHDTLIGEKEVLRETERIDKLRRRIAPSADVIVAAGWPEAVIGRAVRERHASLLITGACWRTVLAAEPTCPVLRLAHHPGGAIARRIDPPIEQRRVA
jgi:nucleotide-binding universal stress UspA family protein